MEWTKQTISVILAQNKLLRKGWRVMAETCTEKAGSRLREKQRILSVAAGREKADLVFKNARYVNVFSNEICRADIALAQGRIVGIGRYSGRQEIDASEKIILPGFLDAHVHLESSLLLPGAFAGAVLPHGTTTVIADPHEIANVMGIAGIQYMLEATQGLPVDVRFMLPSCVPATPLDEAGAVLDAGELELFYAHPRVQGLGEMMDYPGILEGKAQTLEKVVDAQAHRMRIDGHAPDLAPHALNAYVAAGIYSDHECHDLEDAMQKLRRGQFIMIREGTAARNLEALSPLLCQQYAQRCMFCTDDCHVNELCDRGHIDHILRRAIALGADPVAAVKAASFNAAQYFGLNDRGAIAPGYRADLVMIDDFESLKVERVWIKGQLWAQDGVAREFTPPAVSPGLEQHARDTFHLKRLSAEDFAHSGPLGVIGMMGGEITTLDAGCARDIDLNQDILKIALVERHSNTGHIGLGFLKGYGLRAGAVATSIAHDAHNIVAVGENEADIAAAVNCVAELGGGIVVLRDGNVLAQLALPVAGLMSDGACTKVDEELALAKKAARALGVSDGIDPFMTLSFMALPVIPALRLTTRGVLDVRQGKMV